MEETVLEKWKFCDFLDSGIKKLICDLEITSLSFHLCSNLKLLTWSISTVKFGLPWLLFEDLANKNWAILNHYRSKGTLQFLCKQWKCIIKINLSHEMNEMDCELKEIKWNMINEVWTEGNEMKHKQWIVHWRKCDET